MTLRCSSRSCSFSMKLASASSAPSVSRLVASPRSRKSTGAAEEPESAGAGSEAGAPGPAPGSTEPPSTRRRTPVMTRLLRSPRANRAPSGLAAISRMTSETTTLSNAFSEPRPPGGVHPYLSDRNRKVMSATCARFSAVKNWSMAAHKAAPVKQPTGAALYQSGRAAAPPRRRRAPPDCAFAGDGRYRTSRSLCTSRSVSAMLTTSPNATLPGRFLSMLSHRI